MSKRQIGTGILTWNGEERRSNRYGVITLCASNYDEDARAPVGWDEPLLQELNGKRVRLTATVTESRKSGHCGDRFLKVFPSQPKVGDSINFGVGTLTIESNESERAVALRPGDGRRELWIDPRKLYRAHDQTVILYAEETELPFSLAPTGFNTEDSGAEDLGDGSIQVKNVPVESVRILPVTKSLGDGLIEVTFKPQKGRRLPTDRCN
jgi:hypothetical protein